MQNESLFIWALWGAGALLTALLLTSASRIFNIIARSGSSPVEKKVVEVTPPAPPSNVGNVRSK